LVNSPVVVNSSGTLQLNATDALGYLNNNANTPITIFGTMLKANNQSETLQRPVTLSGGTMIATVAATAPNGTWDFFRSGAAITTAPGTANFITGGPTDIFSLRTGTAYFSLGANSTLTINVPIDQNSSSGSSPNLNIAGPGTMILAGTNVYGTAATGGTAISVQVGYNFNNSGGTAGNLLLAGSGNFPRTADGSFQVGYGSTLTISNSATALVQSDLKLGSYAAGSSGTANQTGGALTVSGVDTGNNNRALVIGEFPNETSAYNLSAGSLAVPNGWTYVGWNGTGIFNISGGSATLAGLNFGGTSASSLNLSGNGLLSIGSSGIFVASTSAIATISGGTFQAAASWNTSLPMTLNGPATVALQGNTTGLTGVISGSGNLSLIGPGTMTLSGSNTYSGGTTVPAGVLIRAGVNNALGTGPLYLSGGVSSNGVTAYSLASPLVLSGGTLGDIVNNGALTFTAAAGTLAQSASLTVNSPVTIAGGLGDGGGGFSLTKGGTAGTLTLAGNNTFSGSLGVNGGAVYLGGTNATPSIFVSTGTTLGGAGSAPSAAATVDNNSVLDFSQNGSSTFTFGSLKFNNHASIYLPIFSGTASLAMQTGALTVNGFNNSVQFNFPQTLSPIANGTYRLLAYSSIGGLGSGLNAFSVPNGPTMGGRQSGALAFNPGEIDYVVSGVTPYWNGQQPDWQSSNAWTASPGGTLTSFQSGDNDVFDDTAGSGASGTNVTLNNGDVNPISVTFNNVTRAYTISGSNSIVGGANVQINGAGSVTINNSNSYSGGTQLNAGTLNINNPLAIGSGVLAIAGSGGTLGNTSGGSIGLSNNNPQQWNADFTFNGPYDLNLGAGSVTISGSRTVTLGVGNLTVGGSISGSGAALMITGTGGLNLAGANTYNSGTLLLGGNITASGNTPFGTGPVVMSPASGTVKLSLTGTAQAIGSLSSGGAGTSSIVLGNVANSSATTLTINNAGATAFGGSISDLSQTNSAAIGNLIVAGTGSLSLAGSNTYIGSTTVASGTLQLGSPTALYAGAGVGNAIVNGTLDLSGNNVTFAGLSGTGVVASSTSGTGILTAGTNNASSTFGGTMQSSVQGLTKTGSGVLTLTGPENAPAININGGTLQVGNGGTTGSIANNATVLDNSALVYNLGLAPATVPSGGVTGPGYISVTSAGTAHGGGIILLGSVVTGGSQIYNATATNHGRGSGIEVGGPGTPPAGTITLATTGAGASITLIGDVGEDGGATQNLIVSTTANNAPINLNVSIGYSGDWFSLGAFTVNAGTGAINWTGAYGGGQNQGPLSLTGAINFASNYVTHVTATNTIFPMTLNPTAPSSVSGVLSGPLAVTVGGPSVLAYTNTETYYGGTTISGGTLQLGNGVAGHDGMITSSTSSVTDNAALVYDLAGSQTVSYAISGSGSLSMIGTGALVLAGINTYTGGTFVSGTGVVTATSPSAIEDGTNLYIGNSVGLLGFPAAVVPASAVSAAPASAVPEPGTWVLVAVGIGSAATYRRWRRRHSPCGS
jgi:autotransporter-associated beta strand protein